MAESERLADSAGSIFDFLGGRGRRRPRPAPREEIEDFVSDRANYFPAIEAAAEAMNAALGAARPSLETLTAHAASRHGVSVQGIPEGEVLPTGERFESAPGRLLFADRLPRQSVRFRLARFLGGVEHGALLDRLATSAGLTSPEATERLKRALASYLAGAMLMPYEAFLQSAAAFRHDIMRLSARFDCSFEQVCHRLATLRRPGAEGVPVHFLRTDVAGNISKRFSGSGLRLPRYGGACPRWVVHEALTVPGRIVSQLAVLPDGERYLFVARADLPAIRFGQCHSVMIGAALEHAPRFVYADGLDLAAPALATPVGITCRQCPREECMARAAERIDVPATPR